MARRVYSISNMPSRGGLATAGQHGTIAEDQYWQLENCSGGLDGLISKRPGIVQWGQTLKYPALTLNSDDSTWSAFYPFADAAEFIDNGASDSVNASIQFGELVVGIAKTASGTETEAVGLVSAPTQVDSDNADWSMRFVLRVTNMPIADSPITDGEIIVAVKARAGDDPFAFKILPDRIQCYETGAVWNDVGDAPVEARGIVTLEFRSNGQVYFNDVLVGTGTPVAYPALVVGDYVEFTFTATEDNPPHTYFLTDLMMDGADLSSDEPFIAQRVGSGTDFKAIVAGNQVRRYLLCSTPQHVYFDSGLRNYWRPLLGLTGGNVVFSQFSNELIIFDADDAFSSKLYRWNGTASPELLDDAPPVRFGSEHRSRFFAAGDKTHPLRLYYTAVDQPNVWFAPESDADGQETFDEVSGAGYFNIPGKRGDEVTAVYGEFFGDAIICTNRGVWRLVGASPFSFAMLNITQDVGLGSQAALERLGNDLWGAGRQGVTTLQTIEQFGDVKATMPSGPISDLWNPGITNTKIAVDQDQIYKSSMAWNPTLGLMLFAFAQRGASDVNVIMAYNTANQMWLGPWYSDTVFIASVEIATPTQQSTIHCTNTGKVGVTDPNNKMDFDERYTMRIESPYLSARSLDPAIAGQQKRWKTLRLYIQPRGGWDINIQFQTDDEDWEHTTENQNTYNVHELGKDWRLNVDPDGRIHTNQMVGVIEVPLDRRGRFFKFQLSTADDIDGEDLVFQGYDVEFQLDGPDKEQD